MTQQERELILAEKRWAKEKPLKEREYQLKKDKREFKASHQFKLSTSKMLILFLFINCTLIELFTGWVTVKSFDLSTMTMLSPDFTPLVTLIGAVVGEVIGFAIYALKSARENTTGGIVYETAMTNIKISDSNEDTSNQEVSNEKG